MSTPLGLLDTSAFIGADSIPDDQLPERVLLSAITLAELAAGPLLTDDERERGVRLANLQAAEALGAILPFDAAAARTFARVSAQLRGQGRKRAARSYDALIAATALAHGLPLYTANPHDFEGIEGLTVRAVTSASEHEEAAAHQG